MFDRLEELCSDLAPDVVQVEYGFMAPYARAARAKNDVAASHVLLNTHELVTLARLRSVASDPTSRANRSELARWSRYESRLHGWADTVGCVTEQDRTLLHALTGAANLRTLPLGVALDEIRAREDREADPPRLLFVGSFAHPPNVESARGLLADILPRVRGKLPAVVAESSVRPSRSHPSVTQRAGERDPWASSTISTPPSVARRSSSHRCSRAVGSRSRSSRPWDAVRPS